MIKEGTCTSLVTPFPLARKFWLKEWPFIFSSHSSLYTGIHVQNTCDSIIPSIKRIIFQQFITSATEVIQTVSNEAYNVTLYTFFLLYTTQSLVNNIQQLTSPSPKPKFKTKTRTGLTKMSQATSPPHQKVSKDRCVSKWVRWKLQVSQGVKGGGSFSSDVF